MQTIEQVKAIAAEMAAHPEENIRQLWARFGRTLTAWEFLGAFAVSYGRALPETAALAPHWGYFGLLSLSLSDQKKHIIDREPFQVAVRGKAGDVEIHRKRYDELTKRDCEVLFTRGRGWLEKIVGALELGEEYEAQFRRGKIASITRVHRRKP